jgi:hypothetical protein
MHTCKDNLTPLLYSGKIKKKKCFSGPSPKATEIKAKINQWDLINKLLHSKGNKKATYRMGENSFK